MKVTIRQLNGCLSAMQVAKINPGSQKTLEELIQTMISSKKDSIEFDDENPWCKRIIKMSTIHTDLVRVQRHNEIPRHTIRV